MVLKPGLIGFLLSELVLVCLLLLVAADGLLIWASPSPLPVFGKGTKDWGVTISFV